MALALSVIHTPADVLTVLSEVVSVMARGEITPDEAATIAGVIELKRKSIETVEIERAFSQRADPSVRRFHQRHSPRIEVHVSTED